MKTVNQITSIEYETDGTPKAELESISNYIEAPQAEMLYARLQGEEYDHELLDKFEQRSNEPVRAVIEYENETDHEIFDLNIRSDVDANSPANPFSLYELTSQERSQTFLIRKARTYDSQLLNDARNLEPRVLVEDIEDLEDLEQDPGRHDDNTAYLIPEAELVTIALEEGGLNDQAEGNQSYAPITRSNLRLLGKSNKTQPEFSYSEEEYFYITDFLSRPFDVTVSTDKIQSAARRIATDNKLGVEMQTDRKPGEFCLDYSERFGEYILNVDLEFPLLSTHQNRLESDKKDAVNVILEAIENNAKNSGGVKDTSKMKVELEEMVEEHKKNMPDFEDYIYNRLKEGVDPTKLDSGL